MNYEGELLIVVNYLWVMGEMLEWVSVNEFDVI